MKEKEGKSQMHINSYFRSKVNFVSFSTFRFWRLEGRLKTKGKVAGKRLRERKLLFVIILIIKTVKFMLNGLLDEKTLMMVVYGKFCDFNLFL